MRATYRPSPRVPREWLMTTPPRSTTADALIPIPGFDEDEATMAVAAAQALLGRPELDSKRVRKLVVGSRTGKGLALQVATALGIGLEDATEVPQGHDATATSEPGTLSIQSDAPRPGRSVPQGPGPGALAVARLESGEVPAGRDVDASPAATTMTADTVERMSRWEREAPQRVPMGAHIPQATWDRHAASRYRLEGALCREGHISYPARTQCPRCRSPANLQLLPRVGALESFTVVAKGAAPSEFEPLQDIVGEYAVAVTDFGGARVAALVCDTPLEGLRIGAKIEPVFRRLYAVEGAWRYGLKVRQARPAEPGKADKQATSR